jgi:hypothetical protein
MIVSYDTIIRLNYEQSVSPKIAVFTLPHLPSIKPKQGRQCLWILTRFSHNATEAASAQIAGGLGKWRFGRKRVETVFLSISGTKPL